MKTIGTTQKGPFTIVKFETRNEHNDDVDKYFIACGKNRLPEEYNTFEEAEDKINNRDYEVLGLLIETYVNYLTKKQ